MSMPKFGTFDWQAATNFRIPSKPSIGGLQGDSKPRALDLFSGTGSVAKRLTELGYEVSTLEIKKNFNPTFPVDILRWEYRILPPGNFRITAASPPCTEYSAAKSTAPCDLDQADKYILKILEIVQYFQPELWWIKNPRYGRLRHRSVVRGLPYVDIDYCQFSDWGYQKPTRFWGSPELAHLTNRKFDDLTCENLRWEGKVARHREL